MKSFKQLLNEAAITGKSPDEMALPYSNQLVQHKDVKEIPSGSNKSPEIDRYLKLIGLDNEARFKKKGVGYPWCMAFIYAMFDDFCNKMGLSNPLPKTAGVLDHWNKADSSLKISASKVRSDSSLVKPGQIFFLKTNKTKGHAGIVTSVDTASGTYKTIEGNTNDRLSREGHRVGRNTRKLSSSQLLGFIDYFKGNRNRKFEETIAKVVANAPTDFSPTELEGGLNIEQIKNVQRALLAAGYDLGNYGPNKDGVDGDFGSKTKTALKDWKSKNGMANDSILDKTVYSKITSKPMPDKELEEVVIKPKQTETKKTSSTTSEIKKDELGRVEVIMPGRFPGKTLKIINQDLSNDDNLIVVKAIVENLNSVNSLSNLLNEQNVIRKLRELKKKSDTKLADKYRGSSSESPIEKGDTKVTNILKSGGSDDDVESKPEVLITYRKTDNAYLIEPANSKAEAEMNLKKGDKVRIGDLDRKRLFPLFDKFRPKTREVEIEEISKEEKTIQPVTNNPTLDGQPVVPISASAKAQKGATIAKRLVADLGLTKEQAAGVVGNLWAESGLVPDRIQGSGMKRGVLPQAGNGGYGWAQYTHPNLKTDLINFAKGKGVDLNTQPLTDELNYEYLKHWIAKYPNKFNALKSITDLRGSTDYFLKQYERPADQSEVALNKRSGFAEQVYSQLA